MKLYSFPSYSVSHSTHHKLLAEERETESEWGLVRDRGKERGKKGGRKN
jgi:hypothetical protein